MKARNEYFLSITVPLLKSMYMDLRLVNLYEAGLALEDIAAQLTIEGFITKLGKPISPGWVRVRIHRLTSRAAAMVEEDK